MLDLLLARWPLSSLNGGWLAELPHETRLLDPIQLGYTSTTHRAARLQLLQLTTAPYGHHNYHGTVDVGTCTASIQGGGSQTDCWPTVVGPEQNHLAKGPDSWQLHFARGDFVLCGPNEPITSRLR